MSLLALEHHMPFRAHANGTPTRPFMLKVLNDLIGRWTRALNNMWKLRRHIVEYTDTSTSP